MVRAQRRKFHYIYKITNTINGKFYIGMHSTDDLNDGYFGSGKYLQHSIAKYGKEAHSIEIIEYHESRKSLATREKEIVNSSFLELDLCMNLKVGGDGGWDHLVKDESYYQQRANNGKSTGRENARKTLSKLRKEQPELMLEIASAAGKIGGSVAGRFNIHHMNTYQAIERRKEKFKEIGHSKGEKNSQFGTCWVFSEAENKAMKVQKDELQLWLTRGWRRGRK